MSILTQWDPLGPVLQQQMTRFQRDMARLFDRWGFEPEVWLESVTTFPPVNLREGSDFVYAEAELPGLKFEDLEITVTGDNRLTIKGTRQSPAPDNVQWLRQERSFGTFEKFIDLPVSIDAGKVDAQLQNGVLTIKMAKSPQAKPRKIPVKSE